MYSNSFLITAREHIKCLQGANISGRQTAKVYTTFDVRRHYIIIIINTYGLGIIINRINKY